MCGIAGIFRTDGQIQDVDVAAVRRAVEAQRHRGPDDSGIFQDSRAVLGFRRLAIIDLSPAGHQPMTNEDGTVWVIFNGEIYNYRELQAEVAGRGHVLRSQSDTEILIHGYEEWGIEGLLERLRGMFAFALYDARAGRLLLARDRFGIKPLYYSRQPSGDGLAFASEVKALVNAGLSAGETDRDGIVGFLLFGSVPAPATSVRGVECLMPGHYLSAVRGKMEIRKYWDPRSASPSTGDESELSAVLEDAVQRHLVSDVPVGVFLSGGVDSAGIVAMAARTASRLSTLTVVFDETEFSEAEPARQVAERFHTDHREIRVTAADFVREVPSVLAAMDQPTNDGVNTYFVSRAARQAGLTVVLSGLGGDEVFWGYKHYRWLLTRKNPMHWLGSAPSVLRNGLLSAAVTYGKIRGRENWKRLAFLKNRLSYEALYLAVRGFFAPEQIVRLLGMDSRELRQAVDRHLDFLSAGSSPQTEGAPAFSQIEVRRYMHDQLLRDTDVFSMAHSIEVRVPYLDHCVAGVAFQLPVESKRPQAINKPALVRAIGDGMVTDLSQRRKQGFSFPFAHWMLKHAAALEEQAVHTKLLEPKQVRKLWSAFGSGRLHWSRAWATVVLAQGS